MSPLFEAPLARGRNLGRTAERRAALAAFRERFPPDGWK
jgi:hypothetical protein